MKILLSWLQDYIDCKLTPDQIAKSLTLAGLEVDAVDNVTPKFEKVVVCKVLEVEKHPEADKLCIAKVTDGQQTHQVVCGASNCRVSLKTALAVVGATVLDEAGNPFKIKRSKIRGIESLGMLCAADELGLASGSEGIMEFSEDLQEGLEIADLYKDVVFEISLTPNLGHCSSLIGVARELSASTNAPIHLKELELKENSTATASQISVEILNPEHCPRYACRMINNVTVGPSPDWLKKRLEFSGIRSINNVVDVTNYVLLEHGHPLHAFDYDLLSGKKIRVKNARQGEKFITLDGKERLLDERDLLICDSEKPVAVAGVMGGSNSEVTAVTKNILLEAAYFASTTIRKTSKRLGLISDASKRFERGVDPNSLNQVLDRAVTLIQQVAGGDISQGIVNEGTQQFPRKVIDCRLSRINKILGSHLSLSEVETIFKQLDFPASNDTQNVFKVEIPTYRNDIHQEIDLIEEVARVYGYDNITVSVCKSQPSSLPHAPMFLFEREIRAKLMEEGLQEFLTCDLIGPAVLNIVQQNEVPQEEWVKVLNPTSIEQSIMRTSLLPGLLQAVKYNYDHQTRDIAAFEVGRVHFKEENHYREPTVAGIILSGKVHPHHWESKPKDFDFYDLKGIVENLCKELHIPNLKFEISQLSVLHPGRQASIFSGKTEIGSLGEVHPSVVRRLDVSQRILFAEISLETLIKLKQDHIRMQPIPVYPGSERDWTITIKDDLPIAHIFRAIKTHQSNLLESVSLHDIYRSEKLGKGVKNATFRFVYRDKEKTIAQEKVDSEHMKLTENVLKLI